MATPASLEVSVNAPSVVPPLENVTVPVGLDTPEIVAVKVTAEPSTTLCEDTCKTVVVAGRAVPWRVINWGERIPFVV